MNSIEHLEILIKDVFDLDTSGLSFKESSEMLQPYTRRFQEILDGWIIDCRNDKEVPLEKVDVLLTKASEEMKKRFRFRRPNPKLPNPYDTIEGFQVRLRYLKYEVDKSNIGQPPCFCDSRKKNGVEPDFKMLKKYGRAVLYNEDDDYIIRECNHCKTRWINAAIPGMMQMGTTWREWDPEEFLLREVFEGQ